PQPQPAAVPGLPGSQPGVPGTTAATPVAPRPAPAAPPAPPWIEPTDPVVEKVAETPVAADVATRFALPVWARAPIPQTIPGGNMFKVRRIPDSSKPDERPSLSLAFESIGSGITELTDNGPFADSDFRLRGDVRVLRAAAGRRPIIRLERPRLD